MRRPERSILPRRAQRRAARGFTLIELTVALMAGLIVAMALVQTSKEATNTFHEEVRAAAAEMSLRVSLERLRADLQRVAFMSTANVQGDPMNVKQVGLANPLPNLNTPVAGLQRLSGIQLNFGGSAATAPLSSNANNGINPDSIELGGNYSSPDEFAAFRCPAPPNGAGCGGITICLEWNTPAMWRIRNSANPAATLQAYFNPTYINANPGPGATRFMARLTDDSGHYTYLLTCGGATTTSYGVAGASVNIDPATTILTPAQAGGRGGVAGISAGRLVLSPIEIVHWQILQATSPLIPSSYNNLGTAATPDANEYVLTRQFVDAVTNLPDATTLEVVSEYAVDLKFAFTVDNTALANPLGATPPGSSLLFIQLDNALNATWANNVSAQPFTGGLGPQRIRSVRVRAATRTAFPDRTVNIQPVPNTGQPYMYRYFIPGVTNGLQWARVRTGVTEASLSNQARAYY